MHQITKLYKLKLEKWIKIPGVRMKFCVSIFKTLCVHILFRKETSKRRVTSNSGRENIKVRDPRVMPCSWTSLLSISRCFTNSFRIFSISCLTPGFSISNDVCTDKSSFPLSVKEIKWDKLLHQTSKSFNICSLGSILYVK